MKCLFVLYDILNVIVGEVSYVIVVIEKKKYKRISLLKY